MDAYQMRIEAKMLFTHKQIDEDRKVRGKMN